MSKAIFVKYGYVTIIFNGNLQLYRELLVQYDLLFINLRKLISMQILYHKTIWSLNWIFPCEDILTICLPFKIMIKSLNYYKAN